MKYIWNFLYLILGIFFGLIFSYLHYKDFTSLKTFTLDIKQNNNQISENFIKSKNNNDDDCYVKLFELKDELNKVNSLYKNKKEFFYNILIKLNYIDLFNSDYEDLKINFFDIFLETSEVQLFHDIRENYRQNFTQNDFFNYANFDSILYNFEYNFNQDLSSFDLFLNNKLFKFYRKNDNFRKFKEVKNILESRNIKQFKIATEKIKELNFNKRFDNIILDLEFLILIDNFKSNLIEEIKNTIK